MAPVPDSETIDSQSVAAVIVVSTLASALVTSLIVLVIFGCGCCNAKSEKKAEEPVEKPTSEKTKEPSQKKKEPPHDYVVMDVLPKATPAAATTPGGSVKKTSEVKKQDFAAARDPNYRSLMGVDDKFEPSNKGK